MDSSKNSTDWSGSITFEKLEIRKIRELKTRWEISLEEMAEIALRLAAPDPDMSELSKSLYGDALKANLFRTNTFRNIMLSISNHGYLTLMDSPPEDPERLHQYNKLICIPWVVKVDWIHDGRHRLSALLACGHEETVIARCNNELTIPVEEVGAMYEALTEDINSALEEFKESEEYIAWKSKVRSQKEKDNV